MSGYVDAGYVIVLVTVTGYAAWVVRRERALVPRKTSRRRRES